MRKVISFVLTTLDGYHEGPNHEIDWHNVDDEFNQFSIQQLDEIGTLLFGRVTYELMAAYWPTPAAMESDPDIAARMNSMPKVVVSRTLDDVEWANARLVKDGLAEALAELKQQPGKDIAVFGSSNLTASLMRMGLVDEFRIMVNPVVLGEGRPLFQTADRTNLEARKDQNLRLWQRPAVLRALRPLNPRRVGAAEVSGFERRAYWTPGP